MLFFLFLRRSFPSPAGRAWEAALLLGGARALSLGRAAQLTTEPGLGPRRPASTAKPRRPTSRWNQVQRRLKQQHSWNQTGGVGREGRREWGVPWDLGEACTLRAVSSWSELLHMRCFHFTEENTVPGRKRINSYLHPGENGNYRRRDSTRSPPSAKVPEHLPLGLCPGSGTGVVSKKPKRQKSLPGGSHSGAGSQLREQDQSVREGWWCREGKTRKGTEACVGRERGSGPRKGGKKEEPCSRGCSRPQRSVRAPRHVGQRAWQTEAGKSGGKHPVVTGSGVAPIHPSEGLACCSSLSWG